jgi:hypothetical protein
MKTLLLIITMAIYSQVFPQDSEYLKLWNAFHDECSEIVPDTITEHGIVHYDIDASSGELKLIPIDTAWVLIECGEYKEYENVILWDYSGTTTHLNIVTYVDSSEKETFTTKITREKICYIKLKEPTRDGFWSWLKKNGYRK